MDRRRVYLQVISGFRLEADVICALQGNNNNNNNNNNNLLQLGCHPVAVVILRVYKAAISCIISSRRLGTTLFLNSQTLEDGTDRLTRNVGKKLTLLAA